ncbi:hypothetical protein NC652_032072 [Populus alba x Populus x berolinensis]|nr:hypothetical protein NC652_032072 [Populus alba x Populus x berolinensis]
MRLVNVEALKMKLGMESREIIPFSDLLEACQSIGIARSHDEAVTFAHVLDDAGVVLLFRDQVYLHPDKVGSYPCPPFPSFLLCFICTFLPFYLRCMFLIVKLVFNLLSYVCFHNPINCFATSPSGGLWGQTETYTASPLLLLSSSFPSLSLSPFLFTVFILLILQFPSLISHPFFPVTDRVFNFQLVILLASLYLRSVFSQSLPPTKQRPE